MKRTSEFVDMLEPLIMDLGYILWGIEYLPQGKHAILRILIDADEGITLDDCERVSHEVSAKLDVEDPVSGLYSLEISSPGIPRPLLKPAHFNRYNGCDILLKLYTPIAGKKKMTAKLIASGEEDITVSLGNEAFRLPYSQIVKAYLVEDV